MQSFKVGDTVLVEGSRSYISLISSETKAGNMKLKNGKIIMKDGAIRGSRDYAGCKDNAMVITKKRADEIKAEWRDKKKRQSCLQSIYYFRKWNSLSSENLEKVAVMINELESRFQKKGEGV